VAGWWLDEEAEDLADGPLARHGVTQGQVALHFVPVPASVLLLQDVSGFREVGDDPVGRPFRDLQVGGDVAQTDAGVMGDAQQHPAVIRQESPSLRHDSSRTFIEMNC
jgi:hypothetical protein